MAEINLLDKSVFELIAAGEVIERPASVIKELVENSIDAGATNITVEIMNGGISFMRVSDDGKGIIHEELPAAFLRHATSKVSNSSDLESIMTLGFRGEALASVAAVSKVDVLTKRAENIFGSHYKIEGGEEILHETTGCPDGATIIIKDLFFNTPARLKFLKKDVAEGNAIQGIVDKLALAHPEISFKFIRDNKTVRVTNGDGKYSSSIYGVFGKQFFNSLIPLSYEQSGIKAFGYISSPLFTRASRSMQYFFINGRYIRSSICAAAIEEGYRNNIMTGRFAACVINLEIPADTVDVNVHPAKTEVRFSNEKMIFDCIYFAVKNAVLNAENSREIKLSEPTVKENKSTEFVPLKKPFSEQKFVQISDVYTQPNVLKSNPESFSKVDPQTLYNDVQQLKNEGEKSVCITEKEELNMAETTTDFKYINQHSFVKKEEEKSEIIKKKEAEISQFSVIGEVFCTYIICEKQGEMVLIDKHAAHERFRFEELKIRLTHYSQILLESEIIMLSESEYSVFSDCLETFSELGIEAIMLDNFKVEITAMPTVLASSDIKLIIEKLVENLNNDKEILKSKLFSELLHSVACKGAIKANDYTSFEENSLLAKKVFENEDIRYCPHGRPIIAKLTKSELEKFFNRS